MNNDWMQTFSGKKYYPTAPRPGDVRLVDIAHHLSLTNRFNGATKFPWSVAAHALLVSSIAESIAPRGECWMAALWGLHHDSHEAYLGDLITPVKGRFDFEWLSLEAANDAAIATGLGLPKFSEDVRKIVAVADGRAFATEVRDVAGRPFAWKDPPWPEKLQPSNWDDCKRLFMVRHTILLGLVS